MNLRTILLRLEFYRRGFAGVLLLLLCGGFTHAQQSITDSSGQQYRLIESNHFEMGCRSPNVFRHDNLDYNVGDDDRPIHPVILTKPFYIATSEVSRAQFRQFVDAAGYETTAEKTGSGIVGWNPVNNDRDQVKSSFNVDRKFTWRDPGFKQEDSHPVVGVSYEDAKAYCDWLGKQEKAKYRLPSEAEWECACRAGTSSFFSFGDLYRDQIHKFANIGNVELERASPGRVLLQWIVDVDQGGGDGHVFTSPVASYEPNDWGLYDLHGNVWEWCEDRYLDTYYKQFDRESHRKVRNRAIDPVCQERWNEHGDWRVIRGGSWFVSPTQARSGVRGMFEQKDAACYVGFRVVREPPEEMINVAVDQFQKSQRALEFVRNAATGTFEETNGHIRFVFSCEDLNAEIFQRLAELDYSVELEINPNGQLTPELIENVAQVKRLNGLKISVGGKEIRSIDFAPLASHPELNWLQITGTVDLDDGLLDHFQQADQLRSISIQGSDITDDGLAKLPKLPRLDTLHVATTKSTGKILAQLSGSPLREVSFGSLDDAGAKLLTDFPSIVNVNARRCPITRDGLEAITGLRHLRSLMLEGCQELQDDDFQFLSRLSELDRAELVGTHAGDIAAGALRNLLHVRDLRIGSEFLTDSGMRAICEVVSLQDLVITADATQVTDAGLADFWRLVNLNSLQIESPAITGQGFSSFAEMPKLRRLTLSNGSLSDQSLQHVAAIPNLQELFIGSWTRGGPENLTDAGLLKLAESESLKKITVIRKGTRVTDAAVEELKRKMPKLQVSVR